MQRGRASTMIPLNPFDRRVRPDPYPVYQYMRTVDPVHQSKDGPWILTRYADCRAVLDDPRWSHDADLILEPGRRAGDQVDPTVRLLRASVIFSDPPEHARHRTALEAATVQAMKGIKPRIRRTAANLVKLMRSRDDGIDLIRDFASPLPFVVLADMLGVPGPDRVEVQRLTRALAGGLDPLARGAGVAAAGGAAMGLAEYVLDLLDEDRANARGGMLAALRGTAGDLRTWALIADLVAFLGTGVETSSALLGNALLALLRNQEQCDRLRGEPELMATALEELIRFDGPVHLTARVAVEDMQVGGERIPAGDQVIVLLAAANRDPARFADPDRLDLGRVENPHIGFGGGVHECFAAPLARIIAGTAIQALLDSWRRLELAGDPSWHDAVTVRALSKLPVTAER